MTDWAAAMRNQSRRA